MARTAAPLLENTPGAYYSVEGSRVLVHRPVRLPGQAQLRDVVYTVWLASGAFGLPVFTALILATPGWSGRTRARALAWGLALLTIAQIASMLVSVDFWQQMPVTILQGPAFYLSGHSARRLQVISAVYYFFEIMGRGFFVLVVYVALLGLRETPGPPDGAPGGMRGVRAGAAASSSTAAVPRPDGRARRGCDRGSYSRELFHETLWGSNGRTRSPAEPAPA